MNNNQIITVKGNDHEWYQQAVFIMKDDITKRYTHHDIKQEAEIIIGNYAKRNGLFPQGKTEKIDQYLNLILWGSACILMICLSLL